MTDYKIVSHKKKRRGKNDKFINLDESSEAYFKRLKGQIIKAQETVSSSEIYAILRECIDDSLKLLKETKITEIVCYGLGNISDDHNVRYQLGLLLELKKLLNSDVFLYDPVFKKVEKELLENLNCSIIDINERGKRKVFKATLFFLPHCPHELLNNLICANWGVNLCDCMIISNSVQEICSNTPERKLQEDLPFVKKVLPFVTELEIPNYFKPIVVFNDLSLHIFEKNKYINCIDSQLSQEIIEISESLKDVEL